MSTATTQRASDGATQAPSWRPFRVTVARRQQLSPSFLRLTFTGDDLDHLGHDGPDQRIKLYVPRIGHRIPEWAWTNWSKQRLSDDADVLGFVRTYTIRAVRPHLRELDVDFVLHGDAGPASAWASIAAVGQEIAIVGPNRLYGADCRGHEWSPPTGARDILIAGDETAVPAIAGILESLRRSRPSGARVQVFLEVPDAADILDLSAPDHANVTWLSRRRPDGSTTPHGELLVDAVRGAGFAADGSASQRDISLIDTVDIDLEVLWEVAAEASGSVYAWVAGEAGAVRAIRRHLVRERGIDKSAVTFMGYWRLGRSLR